jgi:hypothetical protein
MCASVSVSVCECVCVCGTYRVVSIVSCGVYCVNANVCAYLCFMCLCVL